MKNRLEKNCPTETGIDIIHICLIFIGIKYKTGINAI